MIWAFLVGTLAGALLAVGLFVWWIGQHNDLGSVSVYEDEPSPDFVAPEMNLDGPPTMDQALEHSAQTRARVASGWGELRNDGTVVIHTAPFEISGDGKYVNTEPLRVELTTALHTSDPGLDPTGELQEYADAAGYARKSVTWSSASEVVHTGLIFDTREPVDKEFYTAAEFLEWWRTELECDPFELGRLVHRVKHERIASDGTVG